MFREVVSVAAKVRTETDIGASAVSVAFAARTLARQIFESLDGHCTVSWRGRNY